MGHGATGDVALDLRLVDGVDGRPHETAPHHYGPEGVALGWVWVEAAGRHSGPEVTHLHSTHAIPSYLGVSTESRELH